MKNKNVSPPQANSSYLRGTSPRPSDAILPDVLANERAAKNRARFAASCDAKGKQRAISPDYSETFSRATQEPENWPSSLKWLWQDAPYYAQQLRNDHIKLPDLLKRMERLPSKHEVGKATQTTQALIQTYRKVADQRASLESEPYTFAPVDVMNLYQAGQRRCPDAYGMDEVIDKAFDRWSSRAERRNLYAHAKTDDLDKMARLNAFLKEAENRDRQSYVFASPVFVQLSSAIVGGGLASSLAIAIVVWTTEFAFYGTSMSVMLGVSAGSYAAMFFIPIPAVIFASWALWHLYAPLGGSR